MDIEVAGLVTKLAIDDSDLEKSMAGLSREMNLTKTQFAAASSGLNDFGKGTEGLKLKSDALSKQMQIQGTRVAKLQQEHARAVQEKGRDAVETQKLEVRLNRAVAEYNKLDAQLRATNAELARQSSAWTKVGSSLDAAGTRLQNVSRQMDTAGRSLSRNVTAPVIAGTAAIVKFGADFEKSMTGSLAIMGNVSDEMRKDMETAARDVAKTTRFSATDAAESYFYLASAGLDATQAIEAMPRVAAFAQAGAFDMARATDLLTDAQSALGLSVDDVTQNMENMTRVSDVLVKGNTLANAAVEEFALSLTNKGAQALTLMNKEIEEGVAILAVFADQGLKGSEAGTILARTIEGIEERARKSSKEFKALGIEVFDGQGEMRNMADIIFDMEKAFAGMTTEQRSAELAQLGFNERARRGILTLLGSSDALREYEKELRNAAGTTDEVASKQIQNLWDQLGLLKDRLIDSALTMYETLGPTITNVVIPMVEELAGKVESLASWFASLDKETQQNIFKFVALAAAAGPVLMVTSKLTGSVGSLAKMAGTAAKFIGTKTAATTAMAAATTTATGSVGLFGGGLLGVLGPAGLAVAAIAGIGYGAYKLHEHMKQDAIPAIREFGDEVSETTELAINSFLDLYDEADRSLKMLAWSGTEVSAEMAETLGKNFDDMSEQIIAGLEKSRVEGIAALKKFFAESSDITEEEQEQMLNALEEGYENRKGIIEEQSARILEILENASNENRGLTREEQREIDQIRQDMKEVAIGALSETELEQRAILERMRAEGEIQTARQAAAVVANSIEQRDKSVAEAERQYQETVKQIIFMRDDLGEITDETATRMIRGAKTQRDGVVAEVERMHGTIVTEAQNNSRAHLNEVDWHTGQVLSKWQVLRKRLEGVLSNISFGGMPQYYPMPSFDTGGTVPGPIGSPQIIMAHGGETILPTHKPEYQHLATQKTEATIRHEIDLSNVPPHVSEKNLKVFLLKVLKDPTVARIIDQSFSGSISDGGRPKGVFA
ncbi:phage tail tape measure protein [Candidatus Contubernalis alkaliaceticus]|uniref:phage tail tape measure protein n=1 Tax=Candidatus Contubernalis alkaliaceticus TaxID=338645 RepID=UPI001F4BD002|nr:phage tail tape measure protein [Candidatus Contubernalis alkalaceticus]UNC91700.1 phage tail tape measure protein [Candidatus Contubernalis alkalaceticus]